MAFKQASVQQIRSGQITREHGYIVITMCFYPRGLKKELRDEYRSDLAPDRMLFKEFKKYQKEFGHEEGFLKSNYENRFTLNQNAIKHLQELSELSKTKDVYFVCQCEVGERCHREMLLLTAEKFFGVKIDTVFKKYSEYLNRIKKQFTYYR